MPPGMGHGQMPGGAAAGQPLSTGNYEFGPHEAASIDTAGKRSRLWGVASIVVGLLSIVGLLGLLGLLITKGGGKATPIIAVLVAAFPVAVVQLGTGYFYFAAGGRLQQVNATQGADVEHLMQGLKKLSYAFRVEVFITVASLVLGFIGGLLVFLLK